MKRRNSHKQSPKPTSQRLSDWKVALDNFDETAYRICYLVGSRVVRSWRAFVRFTRTLWRPVAHAVYRVLDVLILRYVPRLKKEYRSLREDFSLVGERVHRKHTDRVRRVLSLPLLAIRRHRAVFRAILNCVAPVLALLLLVQTVGYWRGAEFVLALEYGDETAGYIAGEATYANAAAMVQNSIIDDNNTFKIEPKPTLSLTVNRGGHVLDEQAVYNVILEKVGDSVVPAGGLYVDGVFRGALERTKLDALMTSILAANEDPNADHVDFFGQVSVIDGVYPASSVLETETMRQYLATLPIQSVRYETKTEKLAYTTVVEESTEHPLGYQSVKVRGKNGKHKVTEEIISVNGKEQYRTVVESEVLQAPVNQVVVVGGQKYSEDAVAGDGKATGHFIWPLPYTKVISSPFASRWGSFHGAIDISNGSVNGKPIIASDGGVVEIAEFHGSYGYQVVIDHGNGYKTRYAHCSKLMVEAGQKVAQGEYIANVGNTGYSLGAHLHFEIIKNGQLVDPLDYVER